MRKHFRASCKWELHPSIHPSLPPSIHPSLHPSIPPSIHPYLHQVALVTGMYSAHWRNQLLFPSHLTNSWLYPCFPQNSCRTSSPPSVRVSEELGLTGECRSRALHRAPLKTPGVRHPSPAKHLLVITASTKAFWWDGWELRSPLNQAKLRSFAWNWHIEGNAFKTKLRENGFCSAWRLREISSRTTNGCQMTFCDTQLPSKIS